MAESYNTNLVNVAESYLRSLQVPVTTTSLKQQLNENPFFPSLYALSSVFDRFHIPHQAFKLDAKNLDDLTPPFIAYLKNQPNGKDFVLVTSVSKEEVQYIPVFTASNNRYDKRSTPAKQSIATNEKQDTHETHQLLDNWYLPERKNYEVSAKYPLKGEIKQQERQIDEMRKWCDEVGITHIPAIFINGKRLWEKYIP